MSARVKRLAFRLRPGPKAKLAISMVLIGLLLSQIELGAAVEALRNADLSLILGCVLLIVVGRILIAYRWHLLVRAASSKVSLGSLIRLVFVSGFAGFWTPGGVGVELLRVYGLARGTGLALAVSSVMVERLTALCALLGLLLLGLALGPVDLPRAVSLSAGALFALALVSVIALAIWPLRNPPTLPSLGSTLAPLRKWFKAVSEQVLLYRSRPMLLVWVILLSTVLQVLRVLEKVVLAPAVGIHIDFMYFL
jgi:uncharacterized membrane protein YbhN (UPF0104 family)